MLCRIERVDWVREGEKEGNREEGERVGNGVFGLSRYAYF